MFYIRWRRKSRFSVHGDSSHDILDYELSSGIDVCA